MESVCHRLMSGLCLWILRESGGEYLGLPRLFSCLGCTRQRNIELLFYHTMWNMIDFHAWDLKWNCVGSPNSPWIKNKCQNCLATPEWQLLVPSSVILWLPRMTCNVSSLSLITDYISACPSSRRAVGYVISAMAYLCYRMILLFCKRWYKDAESTNGIWRDYSVELM